LIVSYLKQAIETEEEDPIKTCREAIAQKACEVETDYAGPKLDTDEEGHYSITQEFVDGLLEHFKNGGKLPRRYVWEIVLGCAEVLAKEETLVDVKIERGVTCDVIGDVHGMC
jgi:serine/threonine-protein phosphatase 5